MKTVKLLKQAKKARLGVAMFADNRLHFFAGYTKCEHCATDVKVLLTPDEARTLAKTFGYHRQSLKARVAGMLQKWASDV